MRWLCEGQDASSQPAPPLDLSQETAFELDLKHEASIRQHEIEAPMSFVAESAVRPNGWKVSHNYTLPTRRSALKRPDFKMTSAKLSREYRPEPPAVPPIQQPEPALQESLHDLPPPVRPPDAIAVELPPTSILEGQSIPALPPPFLAPDESVADAIVHEDDAEHDWDGMPSYRQTDRSILNRMEIGGSAWWGRSAPADDQRSSPEVPANGLMHGSAQPPVKIGAVILAALIISGLALAFFLT